MKKVLVVEDSRTDAAIIEDLLKREGIDVQIAANAEEGFNKAILLEPDMIIVDLILPGMNGFELCRRLRNEDRLRKAIILVWSSKDNMEDINEAFRCGADDYVIKPPLPEFLARKIKIYLGIK
ncbi:MAG TPA: response regulator [Candidatus Omnitrophota bacterium]|nr:response regulator [Candidatus Omnitrophota bacterium]